MSQSLAWHERRSATPEYVVEVWISDELRARYPDHPRSLYEALHLGHDSEPDTTERQPEPELEAEP